MSAAAVSDFNVYIWGLVHVSICGPKGAADEQVERAANRLHPTGLEHGWKLSKDPTFSGGQPNPCECDQDPDRRHWLLDC